MAGRDEVGAEYVDIETKRGIQKTLSIRLYAPDGSIFIMPHGGKSSRYVSRGYKYKADDVWRAKNKEHEALKAESLELSNFQRENKNRLAAIETKAKLLSDIQAMKAQNEKLEAQEKELDAIHAKIHDVAPEPAPEPEPVSVAVEPAPEPAPAPAKKKPGRPKKEA